MKLFILFSLIFASALTHVSIGQDLRFQLVERHVVPNVIPSEYVSFGLIQQYLYLPGADGYSIYRYDRIKREIDKSVSGRGGGPNEFTSQIQAIHSLKDRLMVVQTRGSVKFLNTSLRYLSRTITTNNIHDISKLDTEEGLYLGCIVSMADFAETGSMHHLAVLNVGDRIDFDLNTFDLITTTENIWLQRCFHANNGSLIAAGRVADNKVYYFDKSGELLKEVAFTSAVIHEFSGSPPGASEVYSKYGIKDTRLPTTGMINRIYIDRRFTVIQGGISAKLRQRTIYVVDLADWSVSTFNLPKPYRQIQYADGKLFCLDTKANPNVIDVFAIVK